MQKLQNPADPPPDEVPPEVEYKHKVAKMTMYGSVSAISVIMWNAAIEKAAKDGNEALVIDINSGGGDIEEGFKTAKLIEETKLKVICVVDGTAASQAFYILQSCDQRYMTRRSRLMLHEPYWLKIDHVTRKNLKEQSRELDILVTSWMEHSAGRMKITPKQAIKRCQDEGGDWWMGYETAYQIGAIDGVVQSVPAVLDKMRNNMAVNLMEMKK